MWVKLVLFSLPLLLRCSFPILQKKDRLFLTLGHIPLGGKSAWGNKETIQNIGVETQMRSQLIFNTLPLVKLKEDLIRLAANRSLKIILIISHNMTFGILLRSSKNWVTLLQQILHWPSTFLCEQSFFVFTCTQQKLVQDSLLSSSLF